METTEFDATLGGTETLPHSINSLKFTAARSIEIAAMTESILRPSKTKLVFQSLPVHMRRRVMSHNCKRLPRKLRQAHLEQLKKSGLPPKQKRPSRKYRRRPANLLEEYNRRKKQIIWLETHIWHAKRFHMTARWGHRLAFAPCDKAFRACYRASSAHCLIQDISYYTPMKIVGSIASIKELFETVTSPACGLSVGAKAYTTGSREGEINLYEANSYPFNYIGKANFLWDPTDTTMWLFLHPAYANNVQAILTDLLSSVENSGDEIPEKKRKIDNNKFKEIQIKAFPGAFNRFRLTGPNSQAVLVKSLKCITDLEQCRSNEWVQQYAKLNNMELYLKEKSDYWKTISSVSSPSQLPPKAVIGLIVKDPRLMRPSHRTKAKQVADPIINRDSLSKIALNISTTPLWNTDLHKTIQSNIMTNGQFILHVTKLNLVPGEIYEDDPKLQSVPVVLIQRPGSQDSNYKKLGYGSGWDVIVPSGYGLPFWLTFIMFGARSGGLRETESLAFEMGESYLPPDSEAGAQNEKRIELELKERYFKLPPSKRVNYVKLGINSPFICPWRLLLKDWSDIEENKMYVLRDWRILEEIQECIKSKKQLPQVSQPHLCLVAVYLHLTAGSLRSNSLICLPDFKDIANVKNIFEPPHEDPNETVRKAKRKEHMLTMKRQRRSRIKLKKKNTTLTSVNTRSSKNKSEPSEYVKQMRELWLPSNITSVRNVGSKETMGYVSQGAFSFTEAHTCGVGYVTYNALNALLNKGLNQVLVRNITSRKYRVAKIEIIKYI